MKPYSIVNYNAQTTDLIYQHQLNAMQAWVWADTEGNYYLQSYGTIVAKYNPNSDVLAKFGYYSRTTSKQITFFSRLFNPKTIIDIGKQ